MTGTRDRGPVIVRDRSYGMVSGGQGMARDRDQDMGMDRQRTCSEIDARAWSGAGARAWSGTGTQEGQTY
jgi:hypothetical protein